MSAPEQLIFVRHINCVTPMTVTECEATIRQFKPSLTASTHAIANNNEFEIRFGGRGQIILWVLGTCAPTVDGYTRIQAQVGIERSVDNLKLVGGLLLLVIMMILAEALNDPMVDDNMFGIVALFFGGFWLVLVGSMLTSQHILRRDVCRLFCE